LDGWAGTSVQRAAAIRGYGPMPPSCGASASGLIFGFIQLYLLAPDKEKGKALSLQSCDGEAREYECGELFRSGITQS
jgi:hypothetical protein